MSRAPGDTRGFVYVRGSSEIGKPLNSQPPGGIAPGPRSFLQEAAMLLTVLLALAMQSEAPLTRDIEFYNPAWSPDSRTLVFESTLDGKYSIYVIGTGGSGLRRLTVDTANNDQPRWSPDGRRIVFSSDRAGHGDLYVMNADGSNQTRLTTTPSGGYYQSSFSPDGRWILFQGRAKTRETRDRVYLMASSGGAWRL